MNFEILIVVMSDRNQKFNNVALINFFSKFFQKSDIFYTFLFSLFKLYYSRSPYGLNAFNICLKLYAMKPIANPQAEF